MDSSRWIINANICILILLLIGCGNDSEWWSQIQFVDSTYLRAKTEYFIGDTVYILFTGEHPHSEVPDDFLVEVLSNLGDHEFIILTPFLSGPDTLTNPRIGKIKTQEGDTLYLENNGILDVKPGGDTIFVHSGWKTFPALDTAYVKRR